MLISDGIKRRFGSLLWFPFVALASNALYAQTDIGPVTVGAGIQTSYEHTNTSGSASSDDFLVNSVRLYVSGKVTDNISLMFNTEYDRASNKVGILDAAAQFSFSPQVNFWAGRFLPPSDRANLYGPYYSNQWGPYDDGIQDGYPFTYVGRDDGVMYWGQFNRVKVSVGAFDGKTTTGDANVLGAARVQIDFWDKEDGYYLNGTYYGDKNLLAIGGATQFQSGHTATTGDFLLEKKLSNAGVFTIESEASFYNRLGGYNPDYGKSKGAYGLASYLFPKAVGIGKFQVLGKFAFANFTEGVGPNYHQKTTDLQLNYIIKQFKARVMSFYRLVDFDKVQHNTWQAGLGLQIQI